jgi:hypothetical protein
LFSFNGTLPGGVQDWFYMGSRHRVRRVGDNKINSSNRSAPNAKRV